MRWSTPGATIGSTAIRQYTGYDGYGVGVAVIDSGVTPWHDDLTDMAGGQRVDRFVDFVNGRGVPYDDWGHGTHVSGIIAGNGFDAEGERSGVAPGAHLIELKTLDASGQGHISDVVAALDYAINQKDAYGIRVVNLSIGAPVSESFNDDRSRLPQNGWPTRASSSWRHRAITGGTRSNRRSTAG